MEFLYLLGGFAGLLIGGELLVRGAVDAARRLGVSPMVIGLTLVGFGTSMPELVTSLRAAIEGHPGIAVGNVVGSNIANILLILGISALLMPIAVARAGFLRDGAVLVAVTLLGIGLMLTGDLTRAMGVVLLAGLAGFLWLAFRPGQAATPEAEVYALEAAAVGGAPGLGKGLAIFAVGLVITILGAKFMVDGAVLIARTFGVSETVIGLTIVAVGTSLPELVTSAMAARKGEGDVAFGNIIGSNIFNILGILGVTALVRPIPIPAEVLGFDLWIMAGATALLVAVAVTGWRITRREGVGLLVCYGGYLALLAM